MIKKAGQYTDHMRRLAASLLVVVLSQAAGAQLTNVETFPDREYYQGKDLFEKKKYSAAQQVFHSYIEQSGSGNDELIREAAYLHAMCAINLHHRDAERLMLDYIAGHPESQKINQAYFELGRFAFARKQSGSTIRWLSEVDRYRLSQEEQAEYFFKLGYSYFQREQYDEARIALHEITGKDTKYTGPAIYYYSHIAYIQENYETALNGFLRLKDDESFKALVPYYISHLYYFQEKWAQLVDYAPPYLESVTEKRYAEMARIIGEAYFHTDRFVQAINYLNKYHEETNYATPEDNYQLGFAYYMTGDYEQARDYFKKIDLGKKELNQSALYHLGDVYLKLGDKKQARLAFSAAASMEYNQRIRQEAMFNYAVVTYELSFSPFNEVIRAFEKYISMYPAAERTDEAYNYLVLAYMNTRNYSAALSSLEKIRRKDQNIERAYQRVAYFRGLELFKNLRFEEALQKFDLSLEYQRYDRNLKALAYYWKGECWYRTEDYDQAMKCYNDFMASEGAFELDVYNTSQYNMAYAWFKKGAYDKARSWFRKFVNRQENKPGQILGDAYNRLGDLYYLDSRYEQAVNWYDKAIELGSVDVDYALYQKGVSLGINGKHREKIIVLQSMIDSWPESDYMADALYELGRSHFIMQQAAQSVPYYERIINDYPNSTYVRKALVELGLINYNLNRNDQALEYYKKAVAEFPGTEEADNALLGIRNVYVDINRVEDYFTYVESLGGRVDVSMSEQDSLTYMAAENIYMQGNCEQATDHFQNYIDRFENGRFLLSAHFYKAECHVKASELEQALESYEYIASRSLNIFTEPALVSAARINFNYRKDYGAALQNYLQLEKMGDNKANKQEARIGMMRCYYQLEQYMDAIDAARLVMAHEKVPEEVEREAQFTVARSFYAQDRFVLAQEEFMYTASEVKSREGAESKYRVAEIHFIRKDYDAAEAEIFEFIDMNTPHQYWMGKAFILLADVYLAQGDDFQASATLQSIIDYYEETDDGILDLARRKKMAIDKRAEQEMQEPEQEELNIEIDESGQ